MPGPLLHRCYHPGCTAEAGYGRNVRLLQGQEGEWSCRAHLWPDFRLPGRPRPAPQEPTPAPPRQGRLF